MFLRRLLNRFRTDRSGNVAITFAICLLPLVTVAAYSVDYNNMSRRKSELQAVTDAAALAGLSGDYAVATDAVKKQRAADFLAAQVVIRRLDNVTSSVTVEKDRVIVNASMPYVPGFGQIVGGTRTLNAQSIATTSPGQQYVNTLDIAMCMDASNNMGDAIAGISKRLGSFFTDLNAAMQARGSRPYDKMRMRIIVFRDFNFPLIKNPPIVRYPFYNLPDQASTLSGILNKTAPDSTEDSDAAQSGYECQYEAMKSPWLKAGDVYPDGENKIVLTNKSLILLWTHEAAKTLRPLYTSALCILPLYPVGMPESESQFRAAWNNSKLINQENKAFVLFGPCKYYEWWFALGLGKSVCGGSDSDATTNFIPKLADSLISTSKVLPPVPPRLTY